MLQRGIETPDMDVRWVSSLSWYFLNFFGLNGLYRLILGGDNCMFRPVASFTFEFRDRSCIFSSHCESPPKYAHASAPNPLTNTRSFQPAPSDRGDFLIATSLLCCVVQFYARPNQQ